MHLKEREQHRDNVEWEPSILVESLCFGFHIENIFHIMHLYSSETCKPVEFHFKGSPKLLQFIPRGSLLLVTHFMAIHSKAFRIQKSTCKQILLALTVVSISTSREIKQLYTRHSLNVLLGKLSLLAQYKSDSPLYSPLFYVIAHPHPMSKTRLPDRQNI